MLKSDIFEVEVGSLLLGIASGASTGRAAGSEGASSMQATHRAEWAEASYAWAEAPRDRGLQLRLLRAPHKVGTLVKRSRTQHHGRNWKRRYFVLSQGELKYYEDEYAAQGSGANNPAGSISLAECVACPSSEDKPHCIMLVRDSSDRLLMQVCDTRWI